MFLDCVFVFLSAAQATRSPTVANKGCIEVNGASIRSLPTGLLQRLTE